MVEAEDWGRVGEVYDFDASGTTDDTGTYGLEYRWDFGDGTFVVTTDQPMVNHTYRQAGEYTVTLWVTDIEGATSLAEKEATVLPVPVPDVGDRMDDIEPGDRIDDIVYDLPRRPGPIGDSDGPVLPGPASGS